MMKCEFGSKCNIFLLFDEYLLLYGIMQDAGIHRQTDGGQSNVVKGLQQIIHCCLEQIGIRFWIQASTGRFTRISM